MANSKERGTRGDDKVERETRMAEERFLLMAQVEMQRLLNDQGLKYKDLALRLGVSEARISQMFGDDANNLTIRSIAKIFHKLGEKPLIMSKAVYERRLAEARGASDPAPVWVMAGLTEAFSVGPCTQVVKRIANVRENSKPANGSDWAAAENAVEARRADAA